MLLAKIKGNKVYFGKLVTFLGEGGLTTRTPYTTYMGTLLTP